MNQNTLKLIFLGQAGFIIQTENGYRIGIDLYLSDCCDRYFGFKRLMPYIYNPSDLNLDLLIATHAHYDHFDIDSIPLIMSEGRTQLLCAYDCKQEVENFGLDHNRVVYIKDGDVFQNTEVTIVAMPCDHGEEAPDAVGLLIRIADKRIYIAGDTCYREDIFRRKEIANVDVFIMPINGAYGNLNEIDAANAAGDIRARLTIPCHYWNFAEHFGNPYLFMKEMNENYPDLKYNVMRVGEIIEI